MRMYTGYSARAGPESRYGEAATVGARTASYSGSIVAVSGKLRGRASERTCST